MYKYLLGIIVSIGLIASNVYGCSCGCDRCDETSLSYLDLTNRLYNRAKQHADYGDYESAIENINIALNLPANKGNLFLLYQRAVYKRLNGERIWAANDFDAIIERFENWGSVSPLYCDAIVGRMSVCSTDDVSLLKQLFQKYKACHHKWPEFEDTEYGFVAKNVPAEMKSDQFLDRIADYMSIGGMIKSPKDIKVVGDTIEVHLRESRRRYDPEAECKENCSSASAIAAAMCSACPDRSKSFICLGGVEFLRRCCIRCCEAYYDEGMCSTQLENFRPNCSIWR